MSQTKTPNMTPTPLLGKSKTKPSEAIDNPSMVFISMSLDMSWRLAIAVLLPLLGGHYLDKDASTSPLFTLIGLVIAGASVYIVIKRTLRIVNEYGAKTKKK